MNASKECVELLTALCAARLDFPPIPRNREGFSKRTGQRYQYADIAAVIDGTATVLAQHGLVLVQSLEDGDGGTLLVSSTLFHAASGQWLSSELTVEKPATMQDFGAVSTYAKRYSMQSLLNVAGEDDDDAAGVSELGVSTASTPAPATNGHTPAPPPAQKAASDAEHPTERDLAALRNLAVTECGEEVSVYEDRIRRLAHLPAQASVSPRLLARTLPIAVYRELYQYYETLLAQLLRPTAKEVSHGPATPTPVTPEPAAAAEGTPAVPPPAASSSAASDPSAGADEATERDRQRLRQEVAQWDLRVSQAEIEHIITRHPYSKARALLWKARRQPSQAEALVAD